MKSKINKSIKFNKILIVITGIVIIYTIVQVFDVQMQIIKYDNNIQVLNEQIYIQSLENEELIQILNDGATDQSVSNVAKDKLGLVVPGERIIVDIGSK